MFLPKGGMALTCGPLWLFRNAAQKTATQLEPATANPRSLGLAAVSDAFIDVLYVAARQSRLTAIQVIHHEEARSIDSDSVHDAEPLTGHR